MANATSQATTPSAAQTTAPQGFISDAADVFKRHPLVTNIILSLFSIGGGALAGLLSSEKYIEREVKNQADKKLAPYEKLFSAISLNQSNEYDKAVSAFKELVNSPEILKFPPSTRDAVYDGLLLAVANSDKPADYEPEIKRVYLRIGMETPSTPWQSQQLGWYYMRTGNYDLAKLHFDSAKLEFESRRDYLYSIDPMRGLLLLAIIKGNIDEATNLSKQILDTSNIQYKTFDDLITDIKQMQNDKNFDSIIARHRDSLQKNINQYIDRLNRESKKRPQ